MNDYKHPRLLTSEEVAEILRIRTVSVMALCRSGALRASRVGRSWRIEETAVREYLDKQQVQA
ncbi:MAG TPA: helix-turn-helix domain-containing protein [Actinomycetes bacterium]